jgi:hypothetical protein
VWTPVVPDGVCEVLSPSATKSDRGVKVPHYHAAGVGHLWMVDVDAEMIEVYRNLPEGWLLVTAITVATGATPPARLEPFDAVPIELDLLFARTPPTGPAEP